MNRNDAKLWDKLLLSKKVVIVMDNLTGHSGTPKVALKLAKGLKLNDCLVRLVVFRKSLDWNNFSSELAGIDFYSTGNFLTDMISLILESPMIVTLMKGSFDKDDRIDFLSPLLSQRLRRELKSSDLVIFMNMWSAVYLALSQGVGLRRVVTYFQEQYSPLPFPLARISEWLLHQVVNNSTKLLAVSNAISKSLYEERNLRTISLHHAVDLNPMTLKKKSYILTDTRWSKERDPFFILEIMKKLDSYTMIVCGKFGSSELKTKFINEIALAKLEEKIILKENVDEAELNGLYREAFCYLRWGATSQLVPDFREKGPSFGLYQAISNGCIPVISNDLGSADEVAKEISPSLVTPKDPNRFVEVIKKLQDDKTFFDYVMQRIIEFRRVHTWKNYASEVLKIAGLQ